MNLDEKFARIAKEKSFNQQGDLGVARFIGSLVRLHAPKRVLELGTGIGFTTFHIASNLAPGAKVDTVENDPSLNRSGRTSFGRGYAYSIPCYGWGGFFV